MADRKIVELLLKQLKSSHDVLDNTLSGTTQEHAEFVPAGTANSIAVTYAHLLMSEDVVTSTMLKGVRPLYEGEFKNKTGISDPMPDMGGDWVNYPAWVRDVKVDLEKAKKYAKAVYAQTQDYLDTLTDSDLEKKIDMSALGMDKVDARYLLTDFIIGHAYSIAGEIAVLKGIQGLKGYPF